MNDAGTPVLDHHLTAEELALLAEGSREQVSARAIEHLARCRSCMAQYADTVRYRAAWLTLPDAFAGDASAPADAARRSRATWVRAGALATVAAGLIALIGYVAMRGPTSRGDALPPVVVAALERVSAEGLVLPGGEAGAADPRSEYRSGSNDSPGLEAVIEDLRVRFEHAPVATRDVFPLAAALLASGDVSLASAYVSEALIGHPQDVRLLILSGVVAHRSADLAGAERQLRRAVDLRPEDPVALFDLALVVAEAHGVDAGRRYFEAVMRVAPGSPLAERARAAIQRSAP